MNSVTTFKTSRLFRAQLQLERIRLIQFHSVLHYFNVYDFHLNVVIKKLLHMRRDEKNVKSQIGINSMSINFILARVSTDLKISDTSLPLFYSTPRFYFSCLGKCLQKTIKTVL